MNRPGVISWGLLCGEPEKLKEYLLLYDEIWVPGLDASHPTDDEIAEWDLDQENLASLDWLAAQGVIREPPIERDGAKPDTVVRALTKMHDRAFARGNKTYPTPEEAALEGAAAIFNIDIALTRLVTYLVWRDKGQVVYPIVFPLDDAPWLPPQLQRTQEVLSVVVKQFPVPEPGIPLEDIVAFKRDAETQYKFAKFWHWTSTVAQQTADRHTIAEEFDWLLTDYSRQLHQLTRETKLQRLEIILNTPGELLEDLVKFKWGSLGARLFQFKKAKIQAHNAEMKLPGSELAYITEATKLLTKKYIGR